jgi:hypothetical protein
MFITRKQRFRDFFPPVVVPLATRIPPANAEMLLETEENFL